MSTPARAGLLERASCLAQVVVDDIDVPVLDSRDIRHIETVMRARPGEHISIIDGSGHWRVGAWAVGGVEAVTETRFEGRCLPETSVCFALVKGDRSEWAVQKLTEVGVDEIVLLTSTDHGVVRWDAAKQQKNHVRMQRIADEAAMQSRRTRLPRVLVAGSLTDLGAGIALAHPGGSMLSIETPKVVIGPEGGWSGSELGMGLPVIDLGTTMLRSETAAVAVGVRLSALRDSA